MADLLNAYESKDFGEQGRAYLSVQRSVQVTGIILIRVLTL